MVGIAVDINDIVPNRAGGRAPGEPRPIPTVFDEYKEKAITLMEQSISDAEGRFDKGLIVPEGDSVKYTPSGNWRILGGKKASEKKQGEDAKELSVMVSIKVGKRNKLPVLPEFKTVDGEVVQVADTGQTEVKVKGGAVSKTLKGFLATLQGMEKDSELGQIFHQEAVDIKAKSMRKNIDAGKVAYNKLEDKFLPTGEASE